MIYVENKRKSLATIRAIYPDAIIIDVTSRGEEPWIKVSPFYPHGGIPVSFSDSVFSASVEGVWQGLKVFENEDIDFSKFTNDAMKGLKRTVRKFGKPLGHRNGVYGTDLLDYGTARRKIYLPTYAWMLDNKAADVVAQLTQMAEEGDVVLLDYDTNGDIANLKAPLSHAALVKLYIEKKNPHLKAVEATAPSTHPPVKERTVPKTAVKQMTKGKPSKPKPPRAPKRKDNPGQLNLL